MYAYFFLRTERIYIAQSTVQTLFTNKTLEINHITTQLQPRSWIFTRRLRRPTQCRSKPEEHQTTEPRRRPPAKAEAQLQTFEMPQDWTPWTNHDQLIGFNDPQPLQLWVWQGKKHHPNRKRGAKTNLTCRAPKPSPALDLSWRKHKNTSTPSPSLE
jgi:hypothetical protein